MTNRDEMTQASLGGQLIEMPRWLSELSKQPPVRLQIDGRTIEVSRVSASADPKGKMIPRQTTIFDAAREAGIQIPILCHREYMNPVAVCRVCSVQVTLANGWQDPRLVAACHRPVEAGMVVETMETNDRVRSAIGVLTELLLSDHSSPCVKHQATQDCELELLATRLARGAQRFPRGGDTRPLDTSSLVIAVDHSACILCDRCVRGCNDIRNNEVIGRRGKGYTAGIAFDLDEPMGDSTCVACGECMVSCPTGALTFRAPVEAKPWNTVVPPPKPLSADDLVGHPLFDGVAHAFLRWNEGAAVRRHFRKGDIICREGEYGSTAFYIESGTVEIFLDAPFKHVRAKKRRGEQKNRGPLGLVRRFASVLVGRQDDRREEESNARYIHIDAPVPLAYDNPIATLEPGEIFGEMTCMSFYPRSATVRAAEDCVVIEMLRNVLYILQRNKKSREMLEEKYRKRAIENHLRSVDLFATLLDDENAFQNLLSYLRPRVQIIRLNPGDVIFRQGDLADALYLVRIGFVKVSETRPGGEHVLAYNGPGKFFGEIGLLSHLPELKGLAEPGVRTATCTALDHVEVIRIDGEDFRIILERHPAVRDQLLQTALARLEENLAARRQVETVPLGEFLSQGLMNAQSLLVLDLERCTRCDECTKACSDTHDGVTRLIREGLRFDRFLVASSCRSCLDPYCMVGCPVGSIRRRKTREIIIEDWCIGCGKCAENCPYGNINMHPFPTGKVAKDPNHPERKLPVVQQKATTCDLCIELDGQPSCVYACPHDAAFRMSGPDLLVQTQGRRPTAPIHSEEVAKSTLRPQG